MKTVLVLFLMAMVGACAPRFDGRGAPVAPIEWRNDDIQVGDGLRLATRIWEAEPAEAILIGVHGFNDYAETFYLAAPFWQKRGVTTIAYDQRGFGRSGQFGIWPGRETLQQDVADVIQAVRARYPDVPVFLIGVSMGGAVVLTRSGREGDGISGQILVGPAVWGWQTLNPLYAFTLSASARLFPSMTVTGKGLRIWPSDNVAMLKKIAKDPLMVRETRTDTLYGLVDLMDEGFDAGQSTRVPTLLLYGAKDRIIPSSAMSAFRARLPDHVDTTDYRDGYHMLLRDLQAPRVWADILAWIQLHLNRP